MTSRKMGIWELLGARICHPRLGGGCHGLSNLLELASSLTDLSGDVLSPGGAPVAPVGQLILVVGRAGLRPEAVATRETGVADVIGWKRALVAWTSTRVDASGAELLRGESEGLESRAGRRERPGSVEVSLSSRACLLAILASHPSASVWERSGRPLETPHCSRLQKMFSSREWAPAPLPLQRFQPAANDLRVVKVWERRRPLGNQSPCGYHRSWRRHVLLGRHRPSCRHRQSRAHSARRPEGRRWGRKWSIAEAPSACRAELGR